MLSKTAEEVFGGVARIRWWRYRYLFLALFLINAFIFQHFFFDQSFSDLNPFPSASADPPEEETLNNPADEHRVPSTYHEPSDPLLVNSSVQPFIPPESSATFSLYEFDFNGQYIGWPLARVCGEVTYTPGLNYICDNNSGGIGNIRNFILTCIRYAIEAGATGLVLPRIQRRSNDNLGALFTSSFQPFSYFFDEKHFRDAMGESCPQLIIYDKPENFPHARQLKAIHDFYPKDLTKGGDGCDERGVNRHLDQHRVKHDTWLRKEYRFPTEAEPVSVTFKWATFFEWPIYRDGPEFATTFGDILRIRHDIEELAAATIGKLSELVIQEASTISKRKALDTPYLGVHLRTEGDALGFWPDFETQSTGYLKEARSHGLKHAYIATGNATEGRRFGDLAMDQLGMMVVGKTDLLRGPHLERLISLSWDQQGLVDFLVLTKSTHFTGCSFSSFAMNIAIKRHTMSEGIHTRPWKSPGDAYSTLVGRFDDWFGDWMFMYECMWP